MLKVKIKSYDEHFDTYACEFTDSLNETTIQSLIPAVMLPYVAPTVCALCEDLPFEAVGFSFCLQLPKEGA